MVIAVIYGYYLWEKYGVIEYRLSCLNDDTEVVNVLYDSKEECDAAMVNQFKTVLSDASPTIDQTDNSLPKQNRACNCRPDPDL